MEKQSYTAWKPELWPEASYELRSLVDDESGLTITLERHDETSPLVLVEIVYSLPRAYRTIDEGYRLEQWDHEWEAASMHSHSAVYVVHNSAFLKELHEMSLGTIEGPGLVHYLVVTNNICIDVLADVEPSVRLLGADSC